MADATYEGFVRAQLASLVSAMDQPYEEAAEDLRRGESLYARFMEAERERHRREMGEWCAEFLRPVRNAWVGVLVDMEAAKAARAPLGKPLSRRAWRRNRGRVTAARVALARVYHEPVTWAWPKEAA
ncbi:hypothetical protein [Methylobacterium aquaticum]|uniref:Uncharacterized protein n=1 Tax=Methylobacterium aquaticum TaxID=270351 RepID=A0A0C6FQV4_9HYPH|nr:hypothetical protein [Methylobacterium aquaticum]BAQ49447.1 hypothetical protein Maq22A_1p36170 [Methylobacterium aquaticum]